MRKCDVCGTLIPYGINRCPNCGQRYKKDRQLQSKSNWIDFQPKQRSKKDQIVSEKREPFVLKKALIVVTSAILILGALGIGIAVIVSRQIFVGADPKIVISSHVYYDYEEFSNFFVSDSLKVKPYADFIDDVVERYHNENHVLNEMEEFVIENGEFVDGYFLSDFVYKDYEVTIALYRYSENQWDLYLYYGTEINEAPMINTEILDMFTQIANLQQGTLENLINTFIQGIEDKDKDYWNTYSISNGTMEFSYFDGQMLYNLKQSIQL